jgi:Cysteine-rich secretory protein family
MMNLISSDQQSTITNYINEYRAKNQAPPLTWSNNVATFSQRWSYYLASNGLFQHSGSPIYGENLSYFQGYGSDVVQLLKQAVDGWYNEITSYDFSNPGFSEKTGHFSCLVWASSTTFGIGFTYNPRTRVAIITFNTSPAGNIEGEFVNNVLPITPIMPITPITPVPVPVPVPVEKPSNKDLLLTKLDLLSSTVQHTNITIIQPQINDIIATVDSVVSPQNAAPIKSILNFITLLIKNGQHTQSQIDQYLTMLKTQISALSI